jgi:hypothetical protein
VFATSKDLRMQVACGAHPMRAHRLGTLWRQRLGLPTTPFSDERCFDGRDRQREDKRSEGFADPVRHHFRVMHGGDHGTYEADATQRNKYGASAHHRTGIGGDRPGAGGNPFLGGALNRAARPDSRSRHRLEWQQAVLDRTQHANGRPTSDGRDCEFAVDPQSGHCVDVIMAGGGRDGRLDF